ncbi:hypothetical protein DFA_07316 [Cavenderia fasciculata]|uniref:Uncharacterized protein n=1 Tax=Cavenderia fasciculata TaxID=261658 RepID=F4PW32_CACFS|nr:uncharacterized protein DFA_07316 [Cavenderia fasciculata]EGG20196.1 hypothetical protein DFA_07316 [Cavenderia fasciculata]|eukprot:XP_004367179.1 hypothetical protein DFA_07316 [Cavenderia fasciculata]
MDDILFDIDQELNRLNQLNNNSNNSSFENESSINHVDNNQYYKNHIENNNRMELDELEDTITEEIESPDKSKRIESLLYQGEKDFKTLKSIFDNDKVDNQQKQQQQENEQIKDLKNQVQSFDRQFHRLNQRLVDINNKITPIQLETENILLAMESLNLKNNLLIKETFKINLEIDYMTGQLNKSNSTYKSFQCYRDMLVQSIERVQSERENYRQEYFKRVNDFNQWQDCNSNLDALLDKRNRELVSLESIKMSNLQMETKIQQSLERKKVFEEKKKEKMKEIERLREMVQDVDEKERIKYDIDIDPMTEELNHLENNKEMLVKDIDLIKQQIEDKKNQQKKQQQQQQPKNTTKPLTLSLTKNNNQSNHNPPITNNNNNNPNNNSKNQSLRIPSLNNRGLGTNNTTTKQVTFYNPNLGGGLNNKSNEKNNNLSNNNQNK